MRAANLVILGPLIFRTLGIEFCLEDRFLNEHKIEKGLIGAAVLAGLVLMLPIAKQSKEL